MGLQSVWHSGGDWGHSDIVGTLRCDLGHTFDLSEPLTCNLRTTCLPGDCVDLMSHRGQ